MGSCYTVSFDSVGIGGIRVSGQYHYAGAKGDTICGICCYIVEGLIDGIVGCFCGRTLFLAEFTERKNYFVIDRLGIVYQCSYNRLDASDSCSFQWRAIIGACSILDFGAVSDECDFIRVMLRLCRERMVDFDTEVGDVVIHCEATGDFDVVPFEVDAVVQVTIQLSLTSWFFSRTVWR